MGGLDTQEQVEHFLDLWRHPGGIDFWTPVVTMEDSAETGAPEVQSDAHTCDVALRRIITQALAHAPSELGKARSTLAKQWGGRKAQLVKEFSAHKSTDDSDVETLIHDLEAVFLRQCVADVRSWLDG